METEVEASKEVMLDDGSRVLVRGRLDILVRRGAEMVAVEVKTSRSDRNLPQRHHVDQVRAYNWLLDTGYSVLLYVTPSRVTQFYVEDRMDDVEVVERIKSRRAPRYSWECSYCHYAVMCPSKVRE